MPPLIEVRGLTAGYGDSRVVRDVDLDVEAGQIVALLGRNGMGKTTLLHALMGLVRPTAGSVRLGGTELAGRAAHTIARAGVAIVPQGRRVFAPLTVEENLRIARRGSGPWTLGRVYELLPALAARRRHRGDQLSGGEQQMLAIGRALLGNPRLVLLDEPSEGLAPAVTGAITGVLQELAGEGLSGVLVEQDLRVAFALAGTVHVMVKGEIVHRAATRDFRRDPATARELLGVT